MPLGQVTALFVDPAKTRSAIERAEVFLAALGNEIALADREGVPVFNLEAQHRGWLREFEAWRRQARKRMRRTVTYEEALAWQDRIAAVRQGLRARRVARSREQYAMRGAPTINGFTLGSLTMALGAVAVGVILALVERRPT